MKAVCAIALVLCSLLCGTVAAAAAPVDRPALQDAMQQQLAALRLQGAVWSLLRSDGSVSVDAVGVKDARSGDAIRPDDRVHIGSVAKTLLATGVLRLVSQGKLALDTPVSRLLTAVEFDNPWAATDPVRIRHLLDHTAGLDDARFSQVFSLRPQARTPLAEAFAGRGPLRVRSRPGSRHSYSNSGYTLLGMVIEAVTGARYEEYLDAHLLLPLGMRDSTFEFTTQAGADADPRLATGHFEDGATQAAVPMYLRPAGQFTTTAADMARFARFLLGDGNIDGKPFIDAALLHSMGEARGTEAAEAGLRVGYGLGLATRDRHGVVGKCHGGSTVGYRAMFCLFPQQGSAFFIAANADIEGVDYGALDKLLVDALQLPAPATAGPESSRVDAREWEGFYVPAPNRFASFALLDSAFGFVRLRSVGDQLRFVPFQGAEVVLLPAGGALFRASDRTQASHAVLLTADGRRVVSSGLQSYERTSLLELIPMWMSLAVGVLGLAWLLLAGALALFSRVETSSRALLVPCAGVLLLVLPLPLFFQQSFLQLGDLTLASGLLALATLLLPITMVVGLRQTLRQRPRRPAAALDALAMCAVLQWSALLAWHGLLPLRLWS